MSAQNDTLAVVQQLAIENTARTFDVTFPIDEVANHIFQSSSLTIDRCRTIAEGLKKHLKPSENCPIQRKDIHPFTCLKLGNSTIMVTDTDSDEDPTVHDPNKDVSYLSHSVLERARRPTDDEIRDVVRTWYSHFGKA